MLRLAVVLMVPFVVLPLACHLSDPAPAPVAETAPAAGEAPLWREAGLSAQPRLEALRRGAADVGYEIGSTPWRTARFDLPTALRSADAATAATPGALLAALVAHLGLADPLGTELWELTSRVWMSEDDVAVGVVLGWGLMDDSVAGHDLRATMRRGARGWYAERLDERFHCARGVTEDGLCV